MSKKFKIKKKKRFFESYDFDLNEYTGLIVISSFLPRETSQEKPLKINITNLYYYKNNFNLLNKYVEEKNILKFTKKFFNLDKGILNILKVYKKNKKVIYLIYIDYKIELKNYNKNITINIFDKKKLDDVYNKDLYQSIYNYNKSKTSKTQKLFYNKYNYINFRLESIFYFLIGNV